METGFIENLKKSAVDLGIDAADISTRIYNLSGIPMMMKLIDHRVKIANGIDVVFDVAGQKPHDVVPGAYIAKKAGATIKSLQGRDITYEELEDLLLKPAAKENELKYVMASTRKLASSLVKLLSPQIK